MPANVRIACVLGALAASPPASAEHACAPPPPEDHDPGMDHAHHADGARVTLAIDVVAADYQQLLYGGHYWGAIPGASVTLGRFELGASLPIYHVLENGAEVDGVGDVHLHAHATAFTRGRFAAGAMVMATAPTGDPYTGLGMGHVMVMPEAWSTWSVPRVALAASVGYGYALGGAAAHAHHGGSMWPIVDPMNASEVTLGGSATIRIAGGASAGLRAAGAIPTGTGQTRAVAGGAIGWTWARIRAQLAIDRGLLGDPFGTRATLETSTHF